jgi:hypothetical protein
MARISADAVVPLQTLALIATNSRIVGNPETISDSGKK